MCEKGFSNRYRKSRSSSKQHRRVYIVGSSSTPSAYLSDEVHSINTGLNSAPQGVSARSNELTAGAYDGVAGYGIVALRAVD